MNKKEKRIVIAIAKDDVARRDVIDALRCRDAVEESLRARNYTVETLRVSKEDFYGPQNIRDMLEAMKAFCVFNLFEGFGDQPQKEAEFAAQLEKMDIPFTGNSAYTLEKCLNKSVLKALLEENEISVPKGYLIRNIEDIDRVTIEPPFFIKPASEDASVGIDNDSLVWSSRELLKKAEKKLSEFPSGVLIEEFIPGKEYNVGMMGNYPYEVLGISVIDYERYTDFSPFLTYDAKWNIDSVQYHAIVPEVTEIISKTVKKQLYDICQRVGGLVRGRGYFRVDIRQRREKLFVLDVNPNPDINRDSGLLRQVYHKGYRYEEFITRLIAMALRHYRKKRIW
ncbi:MAG: D-alanine--D-alanine ligase [Candidatus Omnitrophica bacterium]|nr:D-alanine--D-alanine ligase [Candidatus Omnitrophota bacterium]